MSGTNKGVSWKEAMEGAGLLPKGHLEKFFAERAAEAEAWAKELKGAPAGRPIVRMGRRVSIREETVELGLRTLLQLQQQEALRAFRGRLGWEGDLDRLRTDR